MKLMKLLKRSLAVVLTVALLCGVLPLQTLAYLTDSEKPVAITDRNGNTISISDDWIEAFPYGTFAFANSELAIEEGGEDGVIKLYRLGGTQGKAIAYVSYIPAAAEMDEGEMSYANAAGANDIAIEVEDPLPITEYQPLGKAPDPEESELSLSVGPYSGEGALEGDQAITLEANADTYQWYIYDGSEWNLVSNATANSFVVSAEDYANETYDFRCVYTLEGVSYCTDSVKGRAYTKPAPEVLEEIPTDLDLNPAPSYTALEMDPENPYLGYVFTVTFAEDEWVKEIRVRAPEDDEAEPVKGGYFTIVACDGGSLYDTANTLAMVVKDNDAPDPSELGFALTQVTVDKAEGVAKLTVTRTGGTQNVLSIDYATEDGSAVAGKDYVATSGTLAFFADVTEQTIEIPLIDDGVETEETVDFTVNLSNLLGDSDNLCTLTATQATVSLFNSATSKADNLATMLQDGQAVDISGSLDEQANTAAPVDVGVVTGTQVQDEAEAVVGVLESAAEGDIEPLSYNYPQRITFSRGSGYSNSYWLDRVYVANNNGSFSSSNTNMIGRPTGWSSGKSYGSSGWMVEGEGATTATLSVPNMAYMYSAYKGYYDFKIGIHDWDIYGAEFTYPWASTYNNSGDNITYIRSNVTWDWGFFTGYTYTYSTGGTLDSSWSMGSGAQGLKIGLSRHDAHDADSNAYCRLKDGVLTRRSFSNNLALRVHTANDGESGDGNVATAPQGAASLTANSGVYTQMRPDVSLVSGESGITSGGKLYVGSKLQVTLKNTPSYDPYTGDKLSAAIYLTRSNGSIVPAQITNNGNTYYITMLWSGMTESDLSDTYTVNVVMNRVQDFKLDLSPSVERQKDADGNPLSSIDASKTGAAWDLFWNSAENSSANYISYGYSKDKAAAPHFESTCTTANVSRTGAWTSSGTTDPVKILEGLKNVHWINFNRDAEDRILYNGRIYAGNETIWLDVADLALENATFRYYNKDYLSATSIMKADISSVGLYLDVNCNGKIDGYYDESIGYFVLEDGTEDQLILFLEPGTDYDESLFAPVPVEWDNDGNATKYAQYFIKATYTMTPRSLVPEAGQENDQAQVLPAFITNVTDPDQYARLTDEQKAYRYIVSGLNRFQDKDGNMSDYARSSDGHAMYGAAASKPQIIDIPLGGDISPAKAVDSDNDGKNDSFTWTPDFQGNLLCPFDAPAPLYIEHSLAGDNIPITNDFEIDAGGKLVLGSSAADKLNGYLGAFAGNSTFALCIQKQEHTTAEMVQANGADNSDLALASAGTQIVPTPESSTLAGRGTFPNSDYLKAMEPGGTPDTPEIDMSDSNSDFDEFEVDLGVQLPSTEIGVTDYVSVIMDGYEVGFSIGIPLGGYNSNGDAGAGGVGDGNGGGGNEESGSNWVSPKAANAANAEDMGKLRDFLKNPSKDTIKATDDSYTDALDNGTMSSSGFEVGFSVSMAFLFKYNSVDNTYYFSQFSVAVAAELEFTYQYRLTPCPIVYLYVKVGFGIELGTGATVERKTVEAETPLVSDSFVLTENSDHTYPTSLKSLNITFNGRVALQLFEDEACTKPVEDSTKGYLSSEGGDPVTITMVKRDGMNIDDQGKTYYLRITALEDTTIDRLVCVKEMKTESYWSGFSLSPEGYIEAGAGIGVEIMKFEVFIKISLGCSMTFGAWNEDEKDYDPFSFDEFNFALGLGFRVVLLVFSYEMDLIGYSINYDGEDDKWTHSWTALGDLFGGEIGELSVSDSEGNSYGVHIRLPGYTGDTQSVYSGGNRDELSPLSFEASDEQVPFELSGYSASGDAFKLTDGLITGYDYKVVTVGSENYLVYTIGREGAAHAVDNTMLVLSRLRLTSVDGKDSYGLVNPLDATSDTPYILLDTKEGGTDDGTGDLDFDVWVDGSTIHAAWVSYSTVSQPGTRPTMPDATDNPVPTSGDVTMDETNYDQAPFGAKTAPVVPTSPGPKPVVPDKPVETAYFTVISAQEYEALDETAKAEYTAIANTDPQQYGKPASGYDTYTEAKSAYDSAVLDYNSKLQEHANWVTADAEYQKLLEQYNKDKPAYDAYMAWYNYFKALTDYNASVQQIAADAAKNTVVKTASYDTEAGTGFTVAQTVSGNVGAYVFLPEGEGDGSVTAYAKAVHMDAGERAAAVSDYTAYLTAIGYDPTDANPDTATQQIGAYRLAYQSGLWDAYGKGSILCVAVNGATEESQTLMLTEGQKLDNFEVSKIGDTYYLAYTTSETQYVDASGKQAANIADATDMVTIKRLFLRTFTVQDGKVVWTNHGTDGTDEGKALLLRTLYDYDSGNGGTDGMYRNGTLDTGYNDPYFANLQFLNGKLGDTLSGTSEDFELMAEAAPESFLLFEMNGATYVIREDSLKSIATAHSGSIIPFFSYEAVAGATKAQSTGRAEVTIGADGAGNVAAVYVAPVANTTNNALYISKYDPKTNEWSAGTMLAMNYMQVYEDAITEGWSSEETGNAYLGKRAGYDHGGMDQFVFSNLQIALGQHDASGAALSTQSEDATVSTRSRAEALDLLGEGELSLMAASGETDMTGQLTPDQLDLLGEIDARAASHDTLLVITQGTLTYLKEMTDSGKTYIVPMNSAETDAEYTKDETDKNRKPGVGVYAISYGVGRQEIGEAQLGFVNYDFSAGAKLNASLSFVNTGDVGIRASEANPALVELRAGDTVLASWKVTSNILPGQKVALSSAFTLTETLATGTKLTATISEDLSYAEDGFSASVELMTIEEKPELGFEKSSIEPTGINENGDTVLTVDLQVGNRGNTTAEGVYVQFSYDTGKTDDSGNPVYAPLDITANTLAVSKQTELETLSVSGNDYANGIFFLENAEDGKDIKNNYGRSLQGTITVPASLYQGSLTGSLNVRVEVFSAADNTTAWTDGLITVEHGEYNSVNNVSLTQVEHASFFTAAEKVMLAMGNTMKLPVAVSTTTGDKAPNIVVSEIPATGESTHLGILNFESGDYANGSYANGSLTIVPSSEGSGFIRVTDVNTNKWQDIAYSVTAAGEGINIYIDNQLFTFKNQDGSEYDAGALSGTQDWSFQNAIDKWGADNSRPYLDNLSRGKPGATFSYTTQAQSIDLYFNGKVKVTSDFPGFPAEGKILEATGGEQYASVYFGKNETNYAHTVTIEVVAPAGNGVTADFDRLVEHYGSGGVPKPAEDAAAPHIFWNRSFPDTASIDSASGKTVELIAYILDDGILSSVTVNGNAGNCTKYADGYWALKLDVTAADTGKLSIAALDASGNRTVHNITVDWFNSTTSSGASAEVPTLEAKLMKKQTDGDVELTPDVPFTKNDEAYISASATASGGQTGDASLAVQLITVNEQGGLAITGLTPMEVGKYSANTNGWYLVTARNPGDNADQWAAELITMDRIDTSLPSVTLDRDRDAESEGGDPVLYWSVRKDTSTSVTKVTISELKLNGMPLSIQSGQTAVSGSLTVTHGGLYTAVASDTSGNAGQGTYNLKDIPIKLASGKTVDDLYTITNAWKGDGALTIDPSVLVGGLYSNQMTDAEKASGSYYGSYAWQLVREDEVRTGEALAQLLRGEGWNTDKTFTNLEAGHYTLYVRDTQEPENAATVAAFPLLIGDEAIQLQFIQSVDSESGTYSLGWSAKKGEGALVDIESVTINGYTVAAGTKDATGTLPITHTGAYTLSATDGDERSTVSQSITIAPDGIPISILSSATSVRTDNPLVETDDGEKALITAHNPWNLANNNGAIDIDVGVLIGGQYDEDTSALTQNLYVGRYEWELRKLDDFDAAQVLEDLKTLWLKQNPGKTEDDIVGEVLAELEAERDRLKAEADKGTPIGGWSNQTTISGLGSGRYTLDVRDALNPASGNILSTSLVLDSEYISIRAQADIASFAWVNDGKITAEASGGYGLGGTYQFIIRPLQGEDDALTDAAHMTDPVDADVFPNWTARGWQIADPSLGAASTGVFDELATGWYQITVRPMIDVTTEEMSALFVLYNTYMDAQAEYDAAEKGNTDSGIATAAVTLKNSIASALQTWRSAQSDEKTEAWNAYLALIDSDSGIQTLLEAWAGVNFASGAEKRAYEAAVDAFAKGKAETAANERFEQADTALNTAKSAYETEKARLEEKTAQAYTDTPALWDNAATQAIYVGYRIYTEILISDLRYEADGTVIVNYTDSKNRLSDAAEQRIIRDNAGHDIIARSEHMTVLIPAGTLSDGDDVDQMLMPEAKLPADTEGTLVQWTGKNGEQMYVGWSYVTPDKVYYIASRPGQYEIVTNPVSFTDVPDTYWGFSEIDFTAARELFNGVGADRFSTSGTMSRAMFVTVLGRLADVDVSAYADRAFDDVEPDTWYGPYVAWAAENGIVNGFGNGTFKPTDPVTREQICTILVRYLDSCGMRLPDGGTVTAFPDAGDISDWALDAVTRFQSVNIVKGDESGRFLPRKNATRAEGAAIYARLIQAILVTYDA